MSGGSVGRHHDFGPEWVTAKGPITFPSGRSPGQEAAEQNMRNVQQNAERSATEARDRQTQLDQANQRQQETQRHLDEIRRRGEDERTIRRVQEDARRQQEDSRRQQERLNDARRQAESDRRILADLKRSSGDIRDRDGPPKPGDSGPDALLKRHRGLFGLDEKGLGRDLCRRVEGDPKTVANVLDLLPRDDALQVAREFAEEIDDAALDGLSRTPEGRLTLLRLLRLLGESDREEDREQTERLASSASPSHERMLSESWIDKPATRDAAKRAGVTFQALAGGGGLHVFDEYAVTIDEMPSDPETLLKRMAEDLNGTLKNPRFDAVSTFLRRNEGPATEGEIVDIDILGPDNGSVMLVELAADHFTYQTVTTPFRETGVHPEWGSREFGYQKNDDGSVTFYTRGVSRQDSWNRRGAHIGGYVLAGPAGALLASRGPAALQQRAWEQLLNGIAAEIERGGGKVRENGFSAWRTVP